MDEREMGVIITKLDQVIARLDKMEANTVTQTEFKLLKEEVDRLKSAWHRNAPIIISIAGVLITAYMVFHK